MNGSIIRKPSPVRHNVSGGKTISAWTRMSASGILAFLIAIGMPASNPTAQTGQKASSVLTGPELAAASSFGRGWRKNDIDGAIRNSINDFRDAVYWFRVERQPDVFDFSRALERWPEEIGRSGAKVSLTMNWGNPNYDENLTPYSAEGIQAFARYAAKTVERFPSVDAIEVGNEFNGTNFVKGPVRDMAPLDRARHSAAMVRATRDAVRSVRPDVRILGGATHSLPLAYIWTLLDAAGPDAMDSLAVHPYTTEPEHLVRQVELLRRHPIARDLPLEITEFGASAKTAPSHLIKKMCAMALSGTSRAAWYPLRARKGENFQPLIDTNGDATPAGRAYAFAAKHFSGKSVQDVSPDPFTYACLFDEQTLVIWGAQRDVEIIGDAKAFNATGDLIDKSARISPDIPITIITTSPFVMGETVKLGEIDILADSYDQFSYAPEIFWQADTKLLPANSHNKTEKGFDAFFRVGSKRLDPITYPGQRKRGTPWVPYLSHPNVGAARILPGSLLPAGNRNKPIDVVHRYTSPGNQTVVLENFFAPSKRSQDGIALSIERNGKIVKSDVIKGTRSSTSMTLKLQQGDRLDIVVGPNGNSKGDGTKYRITLRKG